MRRFISKLDSDIRRKAEVYILREASYNLFAPSHYDEYLWFKLGLTRGQIYRICERLRRRGFLVKFRRADVDRLGTVFYTTPKNQVKFTDCIDLEVVK